MQGDERPAANKNLLIDIFFVLDRPKKKRTNTRLARLTARAKAQGCILEKRRGRGYDLANNMGTTAECEDLAEVESTLEEGSFQNGGRK